MTTTDVWVLVGLLAIYWFVRRKEKKELASACRHAENDQRDFNDSILLIRDSFPPDVILAAARDRACHLLTLSLNVRAFENLPNDGSPAFDDLVRLDLARRREAFASADSDFRRFCALMDVSPDWRTHLPVRSDEEVPNDDHATPAPCR